MEEEDNIFVRIFNFFFGKKKKMKLICVGLDNSGKTTMLNTIKPKKMASTEIAPTIGYSIETFSKNNIEFTVFDMSGQGKYREMWTDYTKGVDGIIFVIDSADQVY